MKKNSFWTTLVLYTSIVGVTVTSANAQSSNGKSIVSLAKIKSLICSVLKQKSNKPDLYVANLSLGSGSVYAGNPISFDGSIANDSKKRSPATFVKFYLSNDNVLDGSDQFLYESSLNPINGFSSSSINGSLLIPQNIESGSYFVIAMSDGKFEVKESDESNNTIAVPLLVNQNEQKPDLKITGLAKYQEYRGVIFFIGDVVNESAVSESNSEVALYLSKDATLSADDYFYGSKIIAPIAAGDSAYFEFAVSEEINLETGNYYVLAKADPNNLISEIDENNNISNPVGAYFTQKYYDIIASGGYVLPDPATPGATVELFNYIEVNSNSGTNPFQIATYFSTDGQLDSTDQLLNVSEATGPFRTFMEIPASIAPGKYFLISHVDYLNELAETSESNNISYFELEVVATESFRVSQLNEVDGIESSKIYPNPSEGAFSIRLVSEGNDLTSVANITLLDATGLVVEKRSEIVSGSGSPINFDLTGYAKGMYAIKVEMNGKVQSHKVVVK